MALTEIEYGSLASSSTLNNNFNYLDNRITSVSESISTNNASIYSSIASTNSTISSLQESMSASIESNINTIDTKFSNLMTGNGLYVTTYVNGTSWCREYFSDSEKTTRVWLVQGGVTTSMSVTLPKSYSNTNFTIVANSKGARGANTDYQLHANATSVNSFGLSGQWASGAYWVTYGI